MRVAVVGAGFSGLATASTLLRFGHTVVIFDAAPDVGGVWSAERRYPGLRAQNTGSTYAFSTLRMPEEYALHPNGEQIQQYLEIYARMNKLDQKGRMMLGTKVTKATPDSQGWTLEVSSSALLCLPMTISTLLGML
jgi:dimethylaniline monooxygenase (N-oxide forming)